MDGMEHQSRWYDRRGAWVTQERILGCLSKPLDRFSQRLQTRTQLHVYLADSIHLLVTHLLGKTELDALFYLEMTERVACSIWTSYMLFQCSLDESQLLPITTATLLNLNNSSDWAIYVFVWKGVWCVVWWVFPRREIVSPLVKWVCVCLCICLCLRFWTVPTNVKMQKRVGVGFFSAYSLPRRRVVRLPTEEWGPQQLWHWDLLPDRHAEHSRQHAAGALLSDHLGALL